MKKLKIKSIYFSPTGTTKKILKGIVDGFEFKEANFLELNKMTKFDFSKEETDLLIIGVPTYSSRIPVAAEKLLRKLKIDGIPTVLVAVYGNNKFGDILLEMRNLVKEQGGIPIAAAAFLGEHSFSIEDMPIAANRPDELDMQKAKEFGELIQKHLNELGNLVDFDLQVPGDYPYRELKKLQADPPETDEENCIKCGVCKSVCPVNAITIDDIVSTDSDLCIFCCACVKSCPQSVRKITDQKILDIRKRLYDNCGVRKEPEFFL